MKILHVSDNHGHFPDLKDRDACDVIVHSGDLMPNRTFGVAAIERPFQDYWVREHIDDFKSWIGGKPFLYTPGNHDYIDPTPVLREAGIDARLLCESLLDVEGVSFYGFPWVPIFGDWNWMASEVDIHRRLQPVAELLEQGGIDVLVSHGPMYGCLDRSRSGERCGSRVLLDVLTRARHLPKAILHGHIHEAFGMGGLGSAVVSNAALSSRLLAVE